MARLSDITDSGYLDGLESWSLQDVRARRDEATEIETQLSYLRRMIQGSLEIVAAERTARREGGSANMSQLVEQMPTILADNVHAPGLGRMPSIMAPGEIDPELAARLDAILPASTLAGIDKLDDEDLSTTVSGLTDFEREISSLRKAVFNTLGSLEDEIVRRYRSGEATVDSLLP